MKHMDQSQIKSHLTLQRMVGTSDGHAKMEPMGERRKVTAKDFFKRTREAEIELKSKKLG